MTTQPWHPGERALHERLGIGERMAELGPRVIRDFMPDQHREFFAQLPALIVGSVDDQGAPWAGILTGRPGFASSPDPRTLVITAPREPDDPLTAGLVERSAVGLLGIEPHTRRRNRMNGTITSADPSGLRVEVVHGFGNCPKYIHPRALTWTDERRPGRPERLLELDTAARELITGSDTFFVASYVDLPQGRQVDVSHRGGPVAFVRVDPQGTLTIPDYAGNRFFNTLGNLVMQPRIGLLFVEFERGDLLQISGEAELILEREDPRVRALEGAERAWVVRPRLVVRRPGALALHAQ